MRKVSSTNYLNEQKLHSLCDGAFTLSLLSGRWKLTILVKLIDGEKQFSELKMLIPDITERILSLQLKGLEQTGLIEKLISVDPLKRISHYNLTLLGTSLLPVIDALATWGAIHNFDNR